MFSGRLEIVSFNNISHSVFSGFMLFNPVFDWVKEGKSDHGQGEERAGV